LSSEKSQLWLDFRYPLRQQILILERVGRANKRYISYLENGRTEPKVSAFYRIAEGQGLWLDG